MELSQRHTGWIKRRSKSDMSQVIPRLIIPVTLSITLCLNYFPRHPVVLEAVHPSQFLMTTIGDRSGTSTRLPTEQELIRRICSKSKFVIDNGTIYPDPVDDASTRKSPLSPDESITTRILVIFTCPVQNCGEQFQQQSLLLTHTQQTHDVVHGTAARVPLSAAAASSASTAPKPPSQPDKKKRRGGVAALSCAECRRLKLKCSRVFPCTGCVKKGCAAICPDGHLTTGKGNRFVLANTNELQEKIEVLTKRARALEDALAKSHNIVSPQPHPLLSDDLLQITRTVKEESPEPNLSTDSTTVKEEEDSKREEDEALIVYKSSLGSLSTGEPSTFYGRSGTSWHFLLNEIGANQQKEPPKGTIKIPVPNDIQWLAYSFPFSAPADGSTRQKLIEYLPKAAVARRHSQSFYRYGAWQYTPIQEVDFNTFIYQPFYEPDDTTVFEEPLANHNLAVLFLIIALGALLDLEQPSHSSEAKWYYQLGKASLALEPVLDSSSLSTIQALVLLSYYMLLDDIHDQRWSIMGVASKLTQTAGLHIDGTHWNLPPEETYRRRCLFWEVYSYDILQSLTYGRPPHMALSHIDTKKPFETTRLVDGEVEMTGDAWKHKFYSECLGVIWNRAFGAHPISYDLVKHLDQQMRAYYVPPSLRVPGFGGAKSNQDVHPPSPELTVQRHFLVALKEITSFYMHRGFFATAVNEKPENPIEHHPYGESVQTIYESACICVALMRNLFRHQPVIMQRFPYFFDHIFSCAYVLGAIASKPKVPMAESALTNLELAYDFFEAMHESNPRRVKFLTVTTKLREQARLALGITQNPLTEAQKLARPRLIKTEEPMSDRQHPSGWAKQVPISLPPSTSQPSHTSSQPSIHQYSPTTLTSPSYQTTSYNSPQNTQYPVQQYPMYPSTNVSEAAQSYLTQPFGDSFFDRSDMAYNPVTAYQYQTYQEAGYFQQEMEYQPGYDASGDVPMPMLEESWQTFMTQFRQ
ncbi:fungal-specific transcription factor domain-containing protein [Lentinula raphanica]|nr:fungal-specific transcription factor domain-containing protein [Lentinula raphanica]